MILQLRYLVAFAAGNLTVLFLFSLTKQQEVCIYEGLCYFEKAFIYVWFFNDFFSGVIISKSILHPTGLNVI